MGPSDPKPMLVPFQYTVLTLHPSYKRWILLQASWDFLWQSKEEHQQWKYVAWGDK